ncbi:MAG: cell division ATP-binding protein FtsE [bacterium]|nr:cell division ATP-binding protein FtsE [bacterium]
MIQMHNVSLIYPNGTRGLNSIDMTINRGEFVFLVGHTGSGKSSLMKLIYREHDPTTGAVYVEGIEISDMKRSQIPFLRRRIGVIFQDFRLLGHKTVYENVAYALQVTGTSRYVMPRKVTKALTLVNLQDKADRFPNQLSGGEQQRVAIARALINDPIILLADEPTGNLDPDSSWDIMQILSKVNVSGTTVVVATHNQQLVDVMQKRVIVMNRGEMVQDVEHGKYAISAVGPLPSL